MFRISFPNEAFLFIRLLLASQYRRTKIDVGHSATGKKKKASSQILTF
jgi:hypothetical protein